MRVIAGTAKGRTLVAPKGSGTRPATDRIRETLFAILEPELGDARVLDLYAGAGTLGLEALSRGAAHATFVERSIDALDALRRNLAATGFSDRADVVAENVIRFLDRAASLPAFDLAFLDPPFADVTGLEATLAHPGLGAALAPDATVVVRVLRKHPPTLPAGATALRTKRVGEEDLIFLRYERRSTSQPRYSDPGGGG